MSSRWQEQTTAMRTRLQRPIAQNEIAALVADHYDSASGLTRLPLPGADLLQYWAESTGHVLYGAGDTFLLSQIALFPRDLTAMLGYRSADQND